MKVSNTSGRNMWQVPPVTLYLMSTYRTDPGRLLADDLEFLRRSLTTEQKTAEDGITMSGFTFAIPLGRDDLLVRTERWPN